MSTSTTSLVYGRNQYFCPDLPRLGGGSIGALLLAISRLVEVLNSVLLFLLHWGRNVTIFYRVCYHILRRLSTKLQYGKT